MTLEELQAEYEEARRLAENAEAYMEFTEAFYWRERAESLHKKIQEARGAIFMPPSLPSGTWP